MPEYFFLAFWQVKGCGKKVNDLIVGYAANIGIAASGDAGRMIVQSFASCVGRKLWLCARFDNIGFTLFILAIALDKIQSIMKKGMI